MKFRQRLTTEYIYVQQRNTGGLSMQNLRREVRREGMLDIGYHFIVQRNGSVEQGRDASVFAGHDFENCDKSIYILVDTGITKKITDAQRVGLQNLLEELQRQYPNVTIIKVGG